MLGCETDGEQETGNDEDEHAYNSREVMASVGRGRLMVVVEEKVCFGAINEEIKC